MSRSSLNPDPELRLTPERGNVAFASTDMAWCFTLRSFAQMYADSFGSFLRNEISWKSTESASGSFDVGGFADRLWGDIFFDTERRKFTRKQVDLEQNRTFVHFIIEPLYKLYSQVVSEETDNLRETLESLRIKLKPIMFKMDVQAIVEGSFGSIFLGHRLVSWT